MQATPPRTRPCRVYPYDQTVEDAAAAVQAAVESVAALPAPEDRARAASAVLLVIKQANGALAKLRQADVRTMRAAGMTWSQIGAVIGTNRSRARQIETGAPSGNSSRPRTPKASGSEPAAEAAAE